MNKIEITVERYDELLTKEYAYEVMKLATESNEVWLREFAKMLFFAEPKKAEPTDDKL